MKKTPSGKAGKKGKFTKNSKKTSPKQGVKKSDSEKRRFHTKRESMNRKGILLWGIHAVREALLNSKRTCYRLWTTEAGYNTLVETLETMVKRQIRMPEVFKANKADLEHFLPPGCVHQGIAIEVEPLPPYTLDNMLDEDDGPEIVVVLDQVTDPHNVGAVLRSAAAFGAGAIIVTERGAPTINGVVAKTACGGAEHVPLIPVTNLARAIEALQQENFWCIGLAEEGHHDLSQSKLDAGRIAIVMGAEGDGLRQLTRKKCDELVRLPTQPPIGSLNVSNAAAISLYEIKRQRSE